MTRRQRHRKAHRRRYHQDQTAMGHVYVDGVHVGRVSGFKVTQTLIDEFRHIRVGQRTGLTSQ